MTTVTTPVTAPSKKCVIVDGSIPLLHPLQDFLAEKIKQEGNEMKILIHPHMNVIKGVLTVRSVEGNRNIKSIQGLTLMGSRDESYPTVRNGIMEAHRSSYQLEDGAEFICRDKHYVYHTYYQRPLWVAMGYRHDGPTKFTKKRQFSNLAELIAWQERHHHKFDVKILKIL